MALQITYGKKPLDPHIARCGTNLTGSENWAAYKNWLYNLPSTYPLYFDPNILNIPSRLNWGLSSVFTPVGYSDGFLYGISAPFSNIFLLENYSEDPDLRFKNSREATTTALITGYFPIKHLNPQLHLFTTKPQENGLVFLGHEAVYQADPNLNLILLPSPRLPDELAWEQIIAMTESNSRSIIIPNINFKDFKAPTLPSDSAL